MFLYFSFRLEERGTRQPLAHSDFYPTVTPSQFRSAHLQPHKRRRLQMIPMSIIVKIQVNNSILDGDSSWTHFLGGLQGKMETEKEVISREITDIGPR